MPNRRDFLQSTAALGAGLITATTATAESSRRLTSTTQTALSGGYRGVSSGSLSKVDTHNGSVSNTPVVTTDVGDLPYVMDGDTRFSA